MSWNPFTPSFIPRIFRKIMVSSYHKGRGQAIHPRRYKKRQASWLAFLKSKTNVLLATICGDAVPNRQDRVTLKLPARALPHNYCGADRQTHNGKKAASGIKKAQHL
jgi:hypothetical protein